MPEMTAMITGYLAIDKIDGSALGIDLGRPGNSAFLV